MELTDEQLALIQTMPTKYVQFVLNKINNPQWPDSKCAHHAGYSEASARTQASRMLKNVEVQKFLSTFNVERTKSTIMTRDEMLERLTAMARTNITDVVDFIQSDDELMNTETGELVDGQSVWHLKDQEEMPENALSAISEVTAGKDGLKVKMHNSLAAMKQLAEMQGFEAPKKTEISGPDGGPLQIATLSDEDLVEQLKDLGVSTDE